MKNNEFDKTNILYADDEPYDDYVIRTAYEEAKERKEEALKKYYEYEVEAEVEPKNDYDFWDNFVYAMDVLLDVLPLLIVVAIIAIGVIVFK